ncbi:23S rRNA (pseudouridine(1915)-N(3))-methyltransferase RlmH [Pararhodonellum marinum]|uniref:23S rRNA (pseudouridine(1915)-N(3))-methyltransferase RlmH n=1 Tax=Pararhodonellum marinum TaxID=2755358 RepID=UPI00188EB455|nr:23S rRNA (pseudouridine(1915)-N(3))-methyltransferase RlmH [Pararhodonellum marinum]
MQIKLLAVGKTDHPAIQNLIEEYCKRLGFYIRFELEIIPDLKNSKSLNEAKQKEKEGELILKKVQAADELVLLDETGKSYTSIDFSEYLQKKMNAGIKQLIFVIGGPYGFSEQVYQRANSKLSLSKMTFSHQMIRPFFLEQLYRAFTILKNEPYHHR